MPMLLSKSVYSKNFDIRFSIENFIYFICKRIYLFRKIHNPFTKKKRMSRIPKRDISPFLAKAREIFLGVSIVFHLIWTFHTRTHYIMFKHSMFWFCICCTAWAYLCITIWSRMCRSWSTTAKYSRRTSTQVSNLNSQYCYENRLMNACSYFSQIVSQLLCITRSAPRGRTTTCTGSKTPSFRVSGW